MSGPADSGPSDLEWAHAGRPMPGEGISGDLHLVLAHPAGTLVALVDGAGHGPEAAEAARAAVALLRAHPDEGLEDLLRRLHEGLRDTRGAVATLARVSDGYLSWAGVGNVEAVLVRASPTARRPRDSCHVRPGMLGVQRLPSLRPETLPLHPGDTLVMVSDGIRSQFIGDLHPGEAPVYLVRRLLLHQARDSDDALVLALRYRGTSASAPPPPG